MALFLFFLALISRLSSFSPIIQNFYDKVKKATAEVSIGMKGKNMFFPVPFSLPIFSFPFIAHVCKMLQQLLLVFIPTLYSIVPKFLTLIVYLLYYRGLCNTSDSCLHYQPRRPHAIYDSPNTLHISAITCNVNHEKRSP